MMSKPPLIEPRLYRTSSVNTDFATTILGKYGFSTAPYLGRLRLVFRDPETADASEPEAMQVNLYQFLLQLKLQLQSLQHQESPFLVTKLQTLQKLERLLVQQWQYHPQAPRNPVAVGVARRSSASASQDRSVLEAFQKWELQYAREDGNRDRARQNVVDKSIQEQAQRLDLVRVVRQQMAATLAQELFDKSLGRTHANADHQDAPGVSALARPQAQVGRLRVGSGRVGSASAGNAVAGNAVAGSAGVGSAGVGSAGSGSVRAGDLIVGSLMARLFGLGATMESWIGAASPMVGASESALAKVGLQPIGPAVFQWHMSAVASAFPDVTLPENVSTERHARLQLVDRKLAERASGESALLVSMLEEQVRRSSRDQVRRDGNETLRQQGLQQVQRQSQVGQVSRSVFQRHELLARRDNAQHENPVSGFEHQRHAKLLQRREENRKGRDIRTGVLRHLRRDGQHEELLTLLHTIRKSNAQQTSASATSPNAWRQATPHRTRQNAGQQTLPNGARQSDRQQGAPNVRHGVGQQATTNHPNTSHPFENLASQIHRQPSSQNASAQRDLQQNRLTASRSKDAQHIAPQASNQAEAQQAPRNITRQGDRSSLPLNTARQSGTQHLPPNTGNQFGVQHSSSNTTNGADGQQSSLNKTMQDHRQGTSSFAVGQDNGQGLFSNAIRQGNLQDSFEYTASTASQANGQAVFSNRASQANGQAVSSNRASQANGQAVSSNRANQANVQEPSSPAVSQVSVHEPFSNTTRHVDEQGSFSHTVLQGGLDEKVSVQRSVELRDEPQTSRPFLQATSSVEAESAQQQEGRRSSQLGQIGAQRVNRLGVGSRVATDLLQTMQPALWSLLHTIVPVEQLESQHATKLPLQFATRQVLQHLLQNRTRHGLQQLFHHTVQELLQSSVEQVLRQTLRRDERSFERQKGLKSPRQEVAATTSVVQLQPDHPTNSSFPRTGRHPFAEATILDRIGSLAGLLQIKTLPTNSAQVIRVLQQVTGSDTNSNPLLLLSSQTLYTYAQHLHEQTVREKFSDRSSTIEYLIENVPDERSLKQAQTLFNQSITTRTILAGKTILERVGGLVPFLKATMTPGDLTQSFALDSRTGDIFRPIRLVDRNDSNRSGQLKNSTDPTVSRVQTVQLARGSEPTRGLIQTLRSILSTSPTSVAKSSPFTGASVITRLIQTLVTTPATSANRSLLRNMFSKLNQTLHKTFATQVHEIVQIKPVQQANGMNLTARANPFANDAQSLPTLQNARTLINPSVQMNGSTQAHRTIQATRATETNQPLQTTRGTPLHRHVLATPDVHTNYSVQSAPSSPATRTTGNMPSDRVAIQGNRAYPVASKTATQPGNSVAPTVHRIPMASGENKPGATAGNRGTVRTVQASVRPNGEGNESVFATVTTSRNRTGGQPAFVQRKANAAMTTDTHLANMNLTQAIPQHATANTPVAQASAYDPIANAQKTRTASHGFTPNTHRTHTAMQPAESDPLLPTQRRSQSSAGQDIRITSANGRQGTLQRITYRARQASALTPAIESTHAQDTRSVAIPMAANTSTYLDARTSLEFLRPPQKSEEPNSNATAKSSTSVTTQLAVAAAQVEKTAAAATATTLSPVEFDRIVSKVYRELERKLKSDLQRRGL